MIAESDHVCQKCLKEGHFTFECNNQQAYLYRPSRTALISSGQLPLQYLEPENSEEEEKTSSAGEEEVTSSSSSQSDTESNSSLSEEHKEIRKKLLEKVRRIKELEVKNHLSIDRKNSNTLSHHSKYSKKQRQKDLESKKQVKEASKDKENKGSANKVNKSQFIKEMIQKKDTM
eukprot:CAMPEP_0170514464 /NCGR_PEP_ID=MMETSP0209-20121228/1039_1 /TAXON_ID=665100 ORGANISM="Litonotus pictus, Strain P1" /NCGR_SAMPLE_ID=MMETSP0209 /ASSEMBLY_ACC=CAM_ASM_000301 /LENGTH=173 /DNA_ID=CAMNT_0010798563 /DNA_START=49 /DNA_END=571 /DNA_ORIENTATION=-